MAGFVAFKIVEGNPLDARWRETMEAQLSAVAKEGYNEVAKMNTVVIGKSLHTVILLGKPSG